MKYTVTNKRTGKSTTYTSSEGRGEVVAALATTNRLPFNSVETQYEISELDYSQEESDCMEYMANEAYLRGE